MAAGFMIVSSIVLCAALGWMLGYLFDVSIPLALAGAAVGIVVGFYVVWVRFFRGA